MSYELFAILLVGMVMSIGQAAAIVTAVSGLGALDRDMRRGFDAMDARFEETTREISRGFDAMDARFEKTTREISRGFDAMDARFEKTTREISDAMDARFEKTAREMNRGFEELSRTHRAIAALVVQESEKIQTLLRG